MTRCGPGATIDLTAGLRWLISVQKNATLYAYIEIKLNSIQVNTVAQYEY